MFRIFLSGKNQCPVTVLDGIAVPVICLLEGRKEDAPAFACASYEVSLTSLCRSGRTVACRVPYKRKGLYGPISGVPARFSAFSNV